MSGSKCTREETSEREDMPEYVYVTARLRTVYHDEPDCSRLKPVSKVYRKHKSTTDDLRPCQICTGEVTDKSEKRTLGKILRDSNPEDFGLSPLGTTSDDGGSDDR